MKKIGVVNIDTSHPNAFSEYLTKNGRAQYTAIYNDGFRSNDEVNGFMKKLHMENHCTSIEALADITDIGFVQSCNWDKHVAHALPFLRKGKPVFIDKPIAGNIRDCRTIEKLAQDGAVILGSSSVRYCSEIAEFMAKPEEERGKILTVFGTAGVDEFNYAVHIVEGICAILGTGAETVQFMGRSKTDGKICETFFITWSNGSNAVYNTFQGTWQPFEMVIMTTKSTFQFRIDTSKLYGALLDRICDYLESEKNTLAPVPVLTESIKIMLAGRISRENNGRPAALNSIPDDDPGYDGTKFEKEYGAAQSKSKPYLK